MPENRLSGERITIICCSWWQIEEVLNHQDSTDHDEDAGPLAEITHWRRPAQPLSRLGLCKRPLLTPSVHA